MNRIYLEPGVLVARPDAEPGQSTIVPEAAEALQMLVDTDHELVLVSNGDWAIDLPDGFPPLGGVEDIDGATRGSWFLTSDPELCGPRNSHVRTVLVGPGPATHKATVQRCDLATRDLRAAALEILTREAMTPVG
jgi:hypothetical protein